MVRLPCGCLCFALILCASVIADQPDPRLEGSPKVLIFSYRCTPAHRMVLREAMAKTGAANLDSLKTDGTLDDYHILFSRYVDNDNWDMMVILYFRNSAGLRHWREVERKTPAGLEPAWLANVSYVTTTPADLMRSSSATDHASATSHAKDSVSLLIPYDYKVPIPEVVRYLDGYVVPQLRGWQEERVLSHYEIFVARYGASRPWSLLLLLQYLNEEALGKREQTIAKVRARLAQDSSWKAFADSKQNIRVEKQAVIADEIAKESGHAQRGE